MLRPRNNSYYNLPKVVNTSERRKLVDVKSAVTSRFWSCQASLRQNINLLAKGKDGKGRVLSYRKRMSVKKQLSSLLQRVGLCFSEIRRVEAELNEYDELQRLRYTRLKN